MAVTGVSFGRDVNMSSFLEIEACVSHSGQSVPLKYSQSQGFLMRLMSPHPTSQVLVMSGLHCPFVGQESRSCIFEHGWPVGITCPKLPSLPNMVYWQSGIKVHHAKWEARGSGPRLAKFILGRTFNPAVQNCYHLCHSSGEWEPNSGLMHGSDDTIDAKML